MQHSVCLLLLHRIPIAMKLSAEQYKLCALLVGPPPVHVSLQALLHTVQECKCTVCTVHTDKINADFCGSLLNWQFFNSIQFIVDCSHCGIMVSVAVVAVVHRVNHLTVLHCSS